MSSQEDRELLEMAAKAAGYPIHSDAKWVGAGGGKPSLYMGERGPKWDPLEDDGDALRLASKLEIGLNWCMSGRIYAHAHGGIESCESSKKDRRSNLRRAIVCAAAEIGRSMS